VQSPVADGAFTTCAVVGVGFLVGGHGTKV
jgi:hypothetical protein